MAQRGAFKPGRNQVVDDESGLVWWNDQVVERWDGAIVYRGNNEPDHPQKYIRPGDDPTICEIINPPDWPDIVELNALTSVKQLNTLTTVNPFTTVEREFEDYVAPGLAPYVYTEEISYICPLTGVTVSASGEFVVTPLAPSGHLFQAGIGDMCIDRGHQFVRFSVR